MTNKIGFVKITFWNDDDDVKPTFLCFSFSSLSIFYIESPAASKMNKSRTQQQQQQKQNRNDESQAHALNGKSITSLLFIERSSLSSSVVLCFPHLLAFDLFVVRQIVVQDKKKSSSELVMIAQHNFCSQIVCTTAAQQSFWDDCLSTWNSALLAVSHFSPHRERAPIAKHRVN